MGTLQPWLTKSMELLLPAVPVSVPFRHTPCVLLCCSLKAA